ncbi:uncharacterized protein LOC132697064 [Cylas formicarius]|uniref:uncharacterized protein LOC132697064 n=1 Tax=Cylas formicarius TaxID=197179 RepID=UPI0029585FEC|nr:uncharacterized protein LOC132697064 [Cylas formicarius]
MPPTQRQKFGYADDWAIATRDKSMSWRLKPNPNKTEVCCFHLNTKMAHRQLQVYADNHLLTHNTTPKYLGVTLDRTLSFKQHLQNTAAKLRTRNNIIHKLCGTTWGSNASTLRCSALGLVYSTAEYCAPVWLNSAHTRLVDTQLNTTMRLISGTIKSTPTQWLPLLSFIPPPELRRQNALLKTFKKIQNNPNLPIQNEIANANRNRLRSRNPPTRTAEELRANDFQLNNQWSNIQNEAIPAIRDMPGISTTPPGFGLPRKVWSTLNRIRTGHGDCADFRYKWDQIQRPECDCGAERQTIQHITTECPIRRYDGDPEDFLYATPATIEYIYNLDIKL